VNKDWIFGIIPNHLVEQIQNEKFELSEVCCLVLARTSRAVFAQEALEDS